MLALGAVAIVIVLVLVHAGNRDDQGLLVIDLAVHDVSLSVSDYIIKY